MVEMTPCSSDRCPASPALQPDDQVAAGEIRLLESECRQHRHPRISHWQPRSLKRPEIVRLAGSYGQFSKECRPHPSGFGPPVSILDARALPGSKRCMPGTGPGGMD